MPNNGGYFVGPTNQDTAYFSGDAAFCIVVYDISGCYACAGDHHPTLPLPEISPLITPVCGGGAGAIDITVTEGEPPFTYQWSNGATTEDIANLAAGTYTVTITTSEGCDDIFDIEVPANGLNLNADITPHTSCTTPSGAISLTVNNPGAFTYAWSNGSASAELTGLLPGSYTVTVSGVGNNCVDTATYVVPNEVVPIGGASASATEAFCSLPTGSVDLEVTGGVNPLTYAWSNGASTQDLPAVTPGTYTVTLTADNGCTAQTSATVANAAAQPSLSATTTPNTTCFPPNGGIELSASPPAPIGGQSYAYAWSNGATTEDLPSVTGGTYVVTATLGSCTVTGSYQVPQNVDLPQLILTPTSATCGDLNGSVDLLVTGGTSPYAFAWSNGAATQNLSGIAAGEYAVTVTDIVGCTGTGSATVAAAGGNFGLSAVAVANTNCGSPNGSLDLTVTPADNYVYAWSNGAAVQDLTGIAGGNYSVTVTLNGVCTVTDSYVVSNNILPNDTTHISGTTCDENMAGIFVQNLTSAGGCDSVIISTISLLPTDTTHIFGSICDENMAGIFTQILPGQNGCDSVIISQITLLPDDTTHIFGSTCDAAMAGVFTQNLTGQNGCDSVVIETISLLNSSDTTHIFGSTCDENMAGIFTQIVPGQNGCDSVIISQITLLPNDTTYIFGSTCDENMAGIFTHILTAQSGCDSVVIENVSLAASDTTHIFGTNCDANQTGVFEQILINQNGCDSLVISTIIYAEADTTLIFENTCNAATAGVFTQTLTNQNGCDSVIIETISFVASDTTHIFGTNCDVNQTGVFEQILTNQFGCDSTVISTIIYAEADTTPIFENICDAATAGVFTHIFINQNGCDSVIIETISLLPNDTTYAFDTSCEPGNTGIFQQIWTNQYGCDSTVILSVSFAQSDTTFLAVTTCDQTAAGISWQTLTSSDGCDSVLQTTVTWLPGDSIFLFATTCDAAMAGVFTQNLTGQNGCDSIVTTTVSLLPGSETALFSTTCDASAAGVFVQNFINQNGCDSVIIENISLLPSDTTYIFETTCDAASAGVFTHIFINQNGCDSLIIENISLLPSDTTHIFEITCDAATAGVFTHIFINQNGCDSIIIENIALLESDTTAIFLITCDAASAGVFTQIFTAQNGCDSIVTTTVTWTPPPILNLTLSDFNGWEISCTGGADGSISASASGASPFVFAWSTGSISPQIVGLSAGNYSLTVTDANGCIVSANASLAEPSPLQMAFIVNDLDCFGQSAGAIFVQATGGAAPHRFSLDGVNFQASNAFENLPAGAYQITALDANDCEATELIFIQAPVPVNVELGENQFINAGDGTVLTAQVNVPFDSLASVVWMGLDSAECPNCLTQPVFPLVTTSYSVSVIAENGCRDEDDLTVFVDRRKSVFVPNAFSPNGDGFNDVLLVFAKPGLVKNVRSFLIFDRWGESVFRGENLQPNDPAAGWDGKFRGQALDPAVFAWWLEVEFLDGQVELFEGDVTLVR